VSIVIMLQIFLFQLLGLNPRKRRWRPLFEAYHLSFLRRLLKTHRAGLFVFLFAFLPQSLLIHQPRVVCISLGSLVCTLLLVLLDTLLLLQRRRSLRQLIERHKHVVCAGKLL
jgi:hypothetical protein